MKYDVLALGNAIVDILARCDDQFLTDNELNKGSMQLIDTDQAEALYAKMGPAIEVSGGSAANTAAGIAALGGNTAFIGKVADDQLGQIFAHDLKATGVHYAIQPATDAELPTARSFIFVTPDGERTMNTYLGVSPMMTRADIDDAAINQSSILYLEGYLYDRDEAKAALETASLIAGQNGTRVALTLSDPFCVDRHRDDFRKLISDKIDIVFANLDEALSLVQTDDPDQAAASIATECEIAVITNSAEGATIVADDYTIRVPAHPVAKVEDTTGAGDLYAAGFLYGLSKGMPLEKCGQIASVTAAEVISHMGARPEADLKELIRDI